MATDAIATDMHLWNLTTLKVVVSWLHTIIYPHWLMDWVRLQPLRAISLTVFLQAPVHTCRASVTSLCVRLTRTRS
jgi:hypothetical protein